MRSDPTVRSSGYRPHLDGIRALAVVMVVAFHLGVDWLPGGFVGVDVFFVLSGYLITGILVDEATRTGSVRLGRFFTRRVRRLLPASIAVVVTTVVVAHRWFDAIEFHEVGTDAVWSALYSANWRFATAGGEYFAPGDVPSPLVHYWSLAVEEQFYLCWPFLVAAVAWWARRRGRPLAASLAVAVGVIGVASAVVSVTAAGTPLGYYGLHTRAYQLLAGAGLACVARHRAGVDDDGTAPGRSGPSRSMALLAPAAVAASLGALVWLGHAIEDTSGYPGVPALAVTAASVVLIAALDLTPAGAHQRALGAWPFAALGRWSYSVYIWHWPVIVFAPVLAREWDLPWVGHDATMLAVIAATAGISYLAVERPVRFRLVPTAPARQVIPIGLVCSVLVAAVALEVSRVEPHQRAAHRAADDRPNEGRCPYRAERWPDAAEAEPCLWRDGAGPTVAVVGDSHAQQWMPAFAVLANFDDLRVIRVTRTGCPAPDVTVLAPGADGREVEDRACTEWRRAVLPRLVESYDPDLVVVANRGHVAGLVDGDRRVAAATADHVDVWSAGWDRTLDMLSAGGAEVVVTTILPTMPERVPACLMEQPAGSERCDFAVHVDRRVRAYNDVIRALPTRRDDVGVVDVVPLVCPDGRCPAVIDGTMVRRDDNHVTAAFARRHAVELGELIDAARTPPPG